MGPSGVNRSIRAVHRINGAVALATETRTNDVDRSHVFIGDCNALGIGVGVAFAADLETISSGGAADQIHNDA
jgi:hypothetical protein